MLDSSLCLTLIQLRQNGGELLEAWLEDRDVKKTLIPISPHFVSSERLSWLGNYFTTTSVLSLAEAAPSHLHIMDISLAFVLLSLQAGLPFAWQFSENSSVGHVGHSCGMRSITVQGMSVAAIRFRNKDWSELSIAH